MCALLISKETRLNCNITTCITYIYYTTYIWKTANVGVKNKSTNQLLKHPIYNDLTLKPLTSLNIVVLDLHEIFAIFTLNEYYPENGMTLTEGSQKHINCKLLLWSPMMSLTFVIYKIEAQGNVIDFEP